MGGVWVSSDLSIECPFWFEHTDSKHLGEMITNRIANEILGPDILGPLGERFGVSLDPILRDNNLAPHLVPAEEFVTCVRDFCRAVEESPDLFSGNESFYLEEGIFLLDLKDLLAIARWHLEHGARWIRSLG